MNTKSTLAYVQGLSKPFYETTPNPQAYKNYKIGNKSIQSNPYEIKDSNAIYGDKWQKTGYKNNPIGNALNDYAGHLFNSDGSPLINSNYISGSGANVLGQGLTNLGFGETGAALANSPYLSGNTMQALGQGLTDVGLTGIGSGLGSAASTLGSQAGSLLRFLFL